MPVAVTGSIATDHLMTFPGKFIEQFVEGQMENVSLSFLVDDLVQHRGGAGANMAYGLGLLGLRAGPRRGGRQRLRRVRGLAARGTASTPKSVHWSELKHTARFVCTTDAANNQIASFYSGAMSEAGDIELGPVADRVGELDLVVIGPNDPKAMVRHTEECRQQGYAFAADPSQQLAWADGEMIRGLVDGADLLFTNEYESHLLQQKTGWDVDEVLSRVGTWITTRAAEGVLVRQAGRRADLGHRRPGDQAGRADRRRRRPPGRLHRRPHVGPQPGAGHPARLRRRHRRGRGDRHPGVRPAEGELPRRGSPTPSAPTPPTRSPRTCRG